ncbi:hypothetical protein KAW64_15245 [bacterium]|nr:hypothetical protein [bacterium]
MTKVVTTGPLGATDAARDIIERTNTDNPDENDVTELRRVLAEDPVLWKCAGDLADVATRELINDRTPTVFVRESVMRGLEELRDSLGHARASAIEGLLIEHIALCWLRLFFMEFEYTSARKRGSVTVTQANFTERRLNHTQLRYLRACETLARIRGMGPRALQVNIAAPGGQQVNVAHAPQTPRP